jgi:regulatory protein SWI6
MTAMIQHLSADFAAEIKTKQDNLDVTQAHLRAATRELSEQRKQIQAWQARCSELDQVTQRIRNVEHALVDEEKFDWTGRTELDGGDAMGKAGPAFHRRGQNSTMFVDVSFNVNAEPTLPCGRLGDQLNSVETDEDVACAHGGACTTETGESARRKCGT